MNHLLLLIQLQGGAPMVPPDRLGKTGGLILRDLMLIVGVSLLLGLLGLIWAKRYARRQKRKRHHAQPAILQHPVEEQQETSASHRHRHRRRRRRRRDHAPRNPTLAETGGLPPSRPDSPSSTST